MNFGLLALVLLLPVLTTGLYNQEDSFRQKLSNVFTWSTSFFRPSKPVSSTLKATSMVIDGKFASKGQFKYAVRLIGDSCKCTGSIINEKYILTAAHCFNKGPLKTAQTFWEDLTIVRHYIHPKYQGYGAYDVAIIELKPSSSSSTQKAMKSAAPTLQKSCPSKWTETYTLMGYGLQRDGACGNQLTYASANILSDDDCNRAKLLGFDSRVMKCGFSANKKGLPGAGDSGGPVVVSGAFGTTQVAVIDTTYREHQKDVYWGMTKVCSVLDWIKTIVGKL